MFFFFIAFFTFPDIDSDTRTNEGEETLPMFSMLKIPAFLVTLLLLLVGAVSIGFIQPSIELHLTPLKLKPVELGLILLCTIFKSFSEKVQSYLKKFSFVYFKKVLHCFTYSHHQLLESLLIGYLILVKKL